MDRKALSILIRSNPALAAYLAARYGMESAISRSRQEGASRWIDEEGNRSLQFYPYENGPWIQSYKNGERFHFNPSSLAQMESALDAFLL